MTIWGPAFDAEIEYRRQALSAAAVARRGRRGGRRARSRGATASRRATVPARASGAPALGTPLVAGFTAAPAAQR